MPLAFAKYRFPSVGSLNVSNQEGAEELEIINELDYASVFLAR